jgi:serine/threonine protein kinase
MSEEKGIYKFFTELSLFSSGNFGDVFFARLRLPDGASSTWKESYALKQISLSSEDAIKRECDLLYSLRGNEHVIELLACIACDGNDYPTVYLMFPHFVTTPYAEYLPNITVKELCAFMEKLLSGLDFIHYQKIVHRDINPKNVLFERKRLVLKIIDLGIGRRMHDMPGIRDGGGTYGYRAPELLLGGLPASSELYGKADVWAAGQIFLCLLTGISKWFTPPSCSGRPLMNADGFNLAQFCSLFGIDTMQSCALGVRKRLEVFFPTRKPASFPPGANPIKNILFLRGEDCRFPLAIWEIVGKCFQPIVSQRLSAPQALQLVHNLLFSDKKSGKSSILGNAASMPVGASNPGPDRYASSLAFSQVNGYIEFGDPQTPEYKLVCSDFPIHGLAAWPFFLNFKTNSGSASSLQSPFTTFIQLDVPSSRKRVLSFSTTDGPVHRILVTGIKVLTEEPRRPIPTGYCEICRESFYDTKIEHLMGAIHREWFREAVFYRIIVFYCIVLYCIVLYCVLL